MSDGVKEVVLKKNLLGSVVSHMVIDRSNDRDPAIAEQQMWWAELEVLRNELVTTISGFYQEVDAHAENPFIQDNLGRHKESFDAALRTLRYDCLRFLEAIEKISTMHEEKKGQVLDLEDYQLFNSVFLEYAMLRESLLNKVSPNFTKIASVFEEIERSLQAKVKIEEENKTQENVNVGE